MIEHSCLSRLMLVSLVTGACLAFAAPIPGHQTQLIEGWTLQIDDRLLASNKAETDKALYLLTAQLKAIAQSVPPGPLSQLRKVTLWLSPPYSGIPQRAEYHSSADWLRNNGRNPAMAKGVEITNIPTFDFESKRMPVFVLHELAHAYLDQVLGGTNADVTAAYERAKAGKLYERVERFNGPGYANTVEPAYALVNATEFFAEMTEAFFGRNDFAPFTRDELAQRDPSTFAMLQRVWQVPPSASTTRPGAIDPRCYYRLTSQWRGEGLSLDILNDGKANNTPQLTRSADVSGQSWKLTPEASETYRLTTQWRGGELSLAPAAGNRPLLVKTEAVVEQRWKLTPTSDGYYHLTAQQPGGDLSLDILNDGKDNNVPVLAKTADVSGQRWKLTLTRPCP